MVDNEIQGKEIFLKFSKILSKFYDVNITYVGSVPRKNKIKKSVIKKHQLF